MDAGLIVLMALGLFTVTVLALLMRILTTDEAHDYEYRAPDPLAEWHDFMEWRRRTHEVDMRWQDEEWPGDD